MSETSLVKARYLCLFPRNSFILRYKLHPPIQVYLSDILTCHELILLGSEFEQ